MNHGRELVGRLRALEPEHRRRVLDAAAEEAVLGLEADWPAWAHGGQLPPDDDWRVWVMLAGRGFGKTRAGAEWRNGCRRRRGQAPRCGSHWSRRTRKKRGG